MKNLDKYEIHEELGRGGFGIVYRAVDTDLKRDVALKILRPELTINSYFMGKFRDEAQLVAALDSPNIVTIHDFGEVDGYVFFAMRYMAGGSLKDLLEKKRPIPYSKAVEIFRQVCDGLQVAHEQGLVHRDIKPGNILFDSRGNAVVSDFGLAKAVQENSLTPISGGIAVGTPAYTAPELWEGKPPASSATDVYLLGCVLVEMLSGKKLFDGDSTASVIAQHLVLDVKLVDYLPKYLPEEIQAVIAKALGKKPRDRYKNAAEFMEALDKLGHPKKRPIPKHVWIIGGIALLAALYLLWPKGNPGTEEVTPTETVAAAEKAGSEPTEDIVQSDTTQSDMDTERYAGEIQFSPIDGMRMVYVPAGEFQMGSDDPYSFNENPMHTVYLDAFWIDRTEVTNAMYAKCVAAGACFEPSKSTSNTRESYYGNSDYDEYPVVYVNWDQANTYCTWAGRQLPTEAQWEKAARGTCKRVYPWGDSDPNSSLVNINYYISDTTEVGSYPLGASPYMALDMMGNVGEWVADWYATGYYSSQNYWANPIGPVSGTEKVLRSGSYDNSIYQSRTAKRNRAAQTASNNGLGFRCSLSE